MRLFALVHGLCALACTALAEAQDANDMATLFRRRVADLAEFPDPAWFASVPEWIGTQKPDGTWADKLETATLGLVFTTSSPGEEGTMEACGVAVKAEIELAFALPMGRGMAGSSVTREVVLADGMGGRGSTDKV
ncbi:hypothetical protein ARSEF4850_006184 [Beauveria asiatica]